MSGWARINMTYIWCTWQLTSGSTTVHKVLFLAWPFRINELWTIWVMRERGSFREATNDNYICVLNENWKLHVSFSKFLAALNETHYSYTAITSYWMSVLHNNDIRRESPQTPWSYTTKHPLKIGFCTCLLLFQSSWPTSQKN